MIIFAYFLTFFGCISKEKNNEDFSLSYGGAAHYEYQIKLKMKIISGDANSYNELFYIYEGDNNLSDILAYSFVMANKYDYSRAYYDIYEILSSTRITDSLCYDYENLSCLDKETRKLAIHYFKRAVEKGDPTASEVLLNYYDKDKDYPIEELYTDSVLVQKAKENVEAGKI